MRRSLARDVGVLLISAAALFSSAAVAQRTQVQKKAIDFTATSFPNTASLIGATGAVVKIQSASVASNGVITARITLTDTKGQPLDRLGVFTAGPVSISFIAGVIPAGQTQYRAYTTTVLAATINSNPSQTQAGADSGGTFVQNAIGDYTYTFKTTAPAGFDNTATHTIAVTAYRNLSLYGTFDEWSQVGNDTFSFVPNGAKVAVTRAVVATAACNGCHNPLIGHGGTRIATEVCILCHSPQTINPDTGLTMDFKVLIHKIHSGSSLPSVVAGTPYRVWHRGAWSDFSTVVFPQDTRNCTTCHAAGTAQADNWKTNPSRAACGSCHDDVNFATGVNHVNLPQIDDTQCKNCHTSQQYTEFDASIPGAHVNPTYSAALPGVVAKIIRVENMGAGKAPLVTFSVTDNSGKGYDISKLTQVRIILGGPNVDYQTGPGGIRVSEDPSKTVGSGGVYTYQMTNPIPAGATGSFTVSIQARNSVTLLPGTTKQIVATDSAKPYEYYFSIDKSATVARRQVVATNNCTACHKDLTFVHSGSRPAVMECTICHNPTLTDSVSNQSVNMPVQIHSIHRGENLANPYILGTTNYQEVRFPGDLRDCSKCHINNSYQVDNIGAVAPVATTGGFTPTTLPTAAACQGCHDDKATASHALANTTPLGESCVTCHGVNGAFSVDSVHAR